MTNAIRELPFFLLSTVPSMGMHFCVRLLDSPAIAGISPPSWRVFADPKNALNHICAQKSATKPPTTRCIYTPSHIWAKRMILLLARVGLTFPRGHFFNNAITADDCETLGIVVKLLTPLRNPILTAMTVIHKTRRCPRQTPVCLLWRRHALDWLAGYWIAHPDLVRFIPVDLLATQSREERENYLRPIFEDFIPIGLDALNSEMLEHWTPQNTTQARWSDEWREIKSALLAGKDVRGRDARLDDEIDYYLSQDNIMRLYKEHGYADMFRLK